MPNMQHVACFAMIAPGPQSMKTPFNGIQDRVIPSYTVRILHSPMPLSVKGYVGVAEPIPAAAAGNFPALRHGEALPWVYHRQEALPSKENFRASSRCKKILYISSERSSSWLPMQDIPSAINARRLSRGSINSGRFGCLIMVRSAL